VPEWRRMTSQWWSRRARARRLGAQLPMLASTLARSVHSGSTLVAACQDAAVTSAAPASTAMSEVVAAVGRGIPLSSALRSWADAEQQPGVDLLVTACRVGHDDGGDLAAALDAVAVSLLDRIEVADEARALASQARSSAMVLVALPPFGAACFCLLDPTVAATLVGTPLGWCCLAVGSFLDGLGAWVMRAQVRAALR
jgi:tight adherence protein B